MFIDSELMLKKSQLVGVLEIICQSLDLSEQQFKMAKSRYEDVGLWLSRADSPFLQTSIIYPQGSISLQTSVKPIDRNEYDVDLVCFIQSLPIDLSPAAIKRLVGERLQKNAVYAKIIQEKQRCWRLNYPGEFHLDITPSIPNPDCLRGGELVPDKALKEWKETNPKGYKAWFEVRANIQPNVKLFEVALAKARAEVEALPEPTRFRGVLKRCVQLLKRHRDEAFGPNIRELAPISIIITTLAAKSYEYCVTNNSYDTEFDVLVDVIRHMPRFIRVWVENSKKMYFIENETTEGENFAEKWCEDERLADAFYHWQKKALEDFEKMATLYGIDRVVEHLSKSLGAKATDDARRIFVKNIDEARQKGVLKAVTGVGLAIGFPNTPSIRANTFFGQK